MLDEVDAVLGGRAPSYADVDLLPWTNACVSEALRIHPPVYLSMRSVLADDDLNGYLVKKGSIVIVLTHLLHRDPRDLARPRALRPHPFPARR